MGEVGRGGSLNVDIRELKPAACARLKAGLKPCSYDMVPLAWAGHHVRREGDVDPLVEEGVDQTPA